MIVEVRERYVRELPGFSRELKLLDFFSFWQLNEVDRGLRVLELPELVVSKVVRP